MNKLFNCLKKKQTENIFVKPEKEEFVTPNISWLHSWSLNETRDALSESLFNNIPNEIILYIFRFFSVRHLCNISLVCRSFKIIADQDQLWKSKCDTSKELYLKPNKHIYMKWIHLKNLQNKPLREMKWRMYKNDSMYRSVCIKCPYPPSPNLPINTRQPESIGGFHQHPNSSEEMTIRLSVDIDKTAPELISLLEKASSFQEQWKQSSILKQMIQRYYRFMQLKSSNPPNILLIPTLDIEMVWQTHLLRLEIYKNDCLHLFGRVIDHSLIINNINQSFKEEAFLDTCQLYQKRFGEKYCSLPEKHEVASNDQFESLNHSEWIYSYWDKTHYEFTSNSSNGYENPFSFTESDFILDGKWLNLCKQFMSDANKKLPLWTRLFNKSTGIDLGSAALKRLKKSYERFLYMAKKYPPTDGHGFMPRTYAIDIIWRSHMQEPSKYADDCLRLVGYIIYHDPWPIVEDKTMKKSCDQVLQIWRDEFKCEMDSSYI